MLRLIKKNYFLLISVFLILYFGFNLVSGKRGLFSYIEKKKLLSNFKKEWIFFILYFGFNLVSGERGLFSFIEKKELLSNLKKEELSLVNKKNDLDHKNTLLSTNLDLDYVETLIRERFLFGKEDETIYIIKNNEN